MIIVGVVLVLIWLLISRLIVFRGNVVSLVIVNRCSVVMGVIIILVVFVIVIRRVVIMIVNSIVINSCVSSGVRGGIGSVCLSVSRLFLWFSVSCMLKLNSVGVIVLNM